MVMEKLTPFIIQRFKQLLITFRCFRLVDDYYQQDYDETDRLTLYFQRIQGFLLGNTTRVSSSSLDFWCSSLQQYSVIEPGLIDKDFQPQLVTYISDSNPEVGLYPRVYLSLNDYNRLRFVQRKVSMYPEHNLCSAAPLNQGVGFQGLEATFMQCLYFVSSLLTMLVHKSAEQTLLKRSCHFISRGVNARLNYVKLLCSDIAYCFRKIHLFRLQLGQSRCGPTAELYAAILQDYSALHGRCSRLRTAACCRKLRCHHFNNNRKLQSGCCFAFAAGHAIYQRGKL